MRRLLILKDIIVIFSLSIIFSYMSWWVLFATKKARVVVRTEIVESLETAEETTLTTLPSNLLLPLAAYFPFWIVTFGLIRIFTHLERRRARFIL